MKVFPNLGAIRDVAQFQDVIGALLTITLVAAVLTVVVSAVTWTFGQATGSYQSAARGRAGVIIAVLIAVLAGGAQAWLNFLITLGRQL